MNLTSEQFWNSTPREFFNRQKGYYRTLERQDRQEWIRTRWQTTFLLNIHLGKNQQIKPHDLILFDWEETPKELEPMAPEIMEKVIAAMDREAKEQAKAKTQKTK